MLPDEAAGIGSYRFPQYPHLKLKKRAGWHESSPWAGRAVGKIGRLDETADGCLVCTGEKDFIGDWHKTSQF